MSKYPDHSYACVAASGVDAFDFLQGQLTNDLRLLDDGQSMLSAWCNPKGRVICLMGVVRVDGGYGLVLPAELAEDVVRRLTMFRFRAAVDFEIRAATAEQTGVGSHARIDDSPLERLRSGIAHIGRGQSEKFTPHMLNLDFLDAISLDKGCYTGQEVIARTHYRGASKRRMLRFESAAPVSPGAKVSDGERDVGEVLNAIGADLLAVVPIDKADAKLSVDGIPLEHVPLPYM